MNLTLEAVAKASFWTDQESDRLNEEFRSRLGMSHRYMPARLALSRSLALDSRPEMLGDRVRITQTIPGFVLFGTDVDQRVWVTLIVEAAGKDELSLEEFVALVDAHWRRGIQTLDKEWRKSHGDHFTFVQRLTGLAGLPETGSLPVGETQPADIEAGPAAALNVPVGEIAEDAVTHDKVLWPLSAAGGSPHSAIMGGVGSGKTRTAAAMLSSIREQLPLVPLVAFDFKGDLSVDSSGSGYKLHKAFDAQVLEPPRQPIPLDVLALPNMEDLTVSEAAMRFRDSFAQLMGRRLGTMQRRHVHEAAKRALRMHSPCELHHVRDALLNVYEESEMKEDGATGTMRELCEFPLFLPSQGPAEFFGRSWIINLPPSVAEDRQRIVVNVVLDALDRHLNSLPEAATSVDGDRALRIVCVVDEAHRILGTKLPSLSSLIRMSRSKGGSLMLLSQSPDDFSGEDQDFLNEMGLVAAFSTNAPPKKAGRILGRGADLTKLKRGECLVKLRDQPARRIRAWG